MTDRVLVNGELGGAIASTDRGLCLGDGVFETIAVTDGQPLRWSTHLERLSAGCARLGIPCPSADTLAAERQGLIPGGGNGILRVTVSRGPGGAGYAVPAVPQPTRILRFRETPGITLRGEPATVRTCALRLAEQPALAGIKHLSRLEQILARQEWTDPAIDEGLMYDRQGYLVEATASNLFLSRGGRLLTPRLDRCGVAGVLRSYVLAAAEQLGIEVSIGRVQGDDLERADEVFLTNSIRGLRPVRAVDGRLVASTAPLARRLADAIEGAHEARYRIE